MNLISTKEILDLYQKCGARQDNEEIRTKINTGSLDNRLNFGSITNNLSSYQEIGATKRQKMNKSYY
jgi:hypothetical protein